MFKNKGAGLIAATALIATIGLSWGGVVGRAKRTTVNGTAWYASFDDALSQAKQTKKPILLLSMFGRLDEEMPCANARTLRATLFKDPEFKKLVSEDVIPAWEMVRAVPRIQIDLGDGKKVTRTVRGNAVMYLCNPDGKVVDAFPGIYTAKDFLPAIHESIDKLAHADTAAVLAYHRERGEMIPRTITTASKAIMESPTLKLIGAKPIRGVVTSQTDNDPARQTFLRAASRLSDGSLTPMTPDEAMTMATGQPIDGRSSDEMAREILQADSQINMTRTRPVIHLWFASEKALPTPAQARDTVLETILKIPYKDPYFGLKDVLLPGTPG